MRRPLTHPASRGFTLIEVLMVMVIAAILTTVAVPSFNSLIAKNRTSSYRDLLFGDIFQSRDSATSLGQRVAICAANGAGTACAGSAAWQNGWLVFADDNGNGSLDGSEELIKQQQALSGSVSTPTSPTTDISALVFGRSGFLKLTRDASDAVVSAGGGSISFCHQGYATARQVLISGIGRPSMQSVGGCS